MITTASFTPGFGCCISLSIVSLRRPPPSPHPPRRSRHRPAPAPPRRRVGIPRKPRRRPLTSTAAAPTPKASRWSRGGTGAPRRGIPSSNAAFSARWIGTAISAAEAPVAAVPIAMLSPAASFLLTLWRPSSPPPSLVPQPTSPLPQGCLVSRVCTISPARRLGVVVLSVLGEREFSRMHQLSVSFSMYIGITKTIRRGSPNPVDVQLFLPSTRVWTSSCEFIKKPPSNGEQLPLRPGL